MSKNKKKRTNTHKLDKVAKAQQKNEYFRKIRKVLDVIGCGHLWALLFPRELEVIYSVRCQAINITVAENDFMPAGKLKWIRRLVSAMLKRYEVELIPHGKTVDLDTYFTAATTLIIYYQTIEPEDFKYATKVKSALEPFFEQRLHAYEAWEHLKQIASITGLMMSDLTKRVYWATTGLHIAKPDISTGYHIYWHSAVPDRTYVYIKGEKHLAYRLGLPEFKTGPKWVSIAAGTHNLPVGDAEKDVEVYIQEHALRRLSERNDCVSRETLLRDLNHSFENPKMQYDAKTGKVLIEFYLYKIKTGYFLGSVCGNKLILRTFLFITYVNTPEGNLLRKNTGLKKNEIEFLELDKLSTFMTVEIQENKHIKHIFVEAGCRSLYSLYKILKEKNVTITKHANTSLIEDYLGLDLTKEYLEEEDEPETEEVEDELDDESDDTLPHTQQEEQETKEAFSWKKSSWKKRIFIVLAFVPVVVVAVFFVAVVWIVRKIRKKK
ncbi:MAG: hypothetical protein WCQ95_04220 [Bacteroidota bacterium]